MTSGPRTPDEISVELSSRRTGMSFQRTRMSADRTLMSVIRTSLSLISFGFTIYQFFTKAAAARSTHGAVRFAVVLVLLGILMLVFGIMYHVVFMKGLRVERRQMTAEGLIHGTSVFPASLTLITAVILLAIGLAAILGMTANVGPLGG
jgi:putative membrane protein